MPDPARKNKQTLPNLPLVIPYVAKDGIPTFRDSEIANLYYRMKKEGTADRVFCDGTVTSAFQFLRLMQQPDIYLYLVFDDIEDNRPVAFCWLSNRSQKSAQIHFCFFKTGWGRSAKIAHGVLSQLVSLKDTEGEYWLNVIYGYTPEWNRLALRTVKCAGAEIAGTMPGRTWHEKEGRSYPAVISYFTRDNIDGGKKK